MNETGTRSCPLSLKLLPPRRTQPRPQLPCATDSEGIEII